MYLPLNAAVGQVRAPTTVTVAATEVIVREGTVEDGTKAALVGVEIASEVAVVVKIEENPRVNAPTIAPGSWSKPCAVVESY